MRIERTSHRILATIVASPSELGAVGEQEFLGTSVGLTDKAPDFAPEIGVIFSFGPED